ncbi:MAG: hypothetical protein Q8K75_05070 [Chlamydiales bacterium]|nr:hypothetical protein [Chlamydiales bacterium]
MLKTSLRFILPLVLLCCAGCTAPSITHRGTCLCTYRNGDLCSAEHRLSALIACEMPSGDFRQSCNSSWLLLDRAMTRFACGYSNEAIQDFDKAIAALDFFNQKPFMEQLAQTAFQDDVGAYAGEDFEQVLARVYFALTLLQQNDCSNAFALLRQCEQVQQAIRDSYCRSPVTQSFCVPENALANYLFALMLEKRGDLSNARILYQQANVGCSAEAASGKATVLVMCHNGNVPQKVSVTTDASVVSALALEIFMQCHGAPPALCSLTGIPVPGLVFNPSSMPAPVQAVLDGCTEPLQRWYDVGQAACAALDQKLPVIAARAAARLLVRRGIVACADNASPELGLVADIAMLVANINTRADTRSWGTLPLTIDGARYDVEPGQHRLEFTVDPCGPYRESYCYNLNLPPDSLCIIHVFQLHPGVTQVIVPEHFLSHKGDRT